MGNSIVWARYPDHITLLAPCTSTKRALSFNWIAGLNVKMLYLVQQTHQPGQTIGNGFVTFKAGNEILLIKENGCDLSTAPSTVENPRVYEQIRYDFIKIREIRHDDSSLSTSGACTEPAPVMVAITLNPPAEIEDELNDWYRDEVGAFTIKF